MRHVLKKLRFHGNCSLVFFGVPLYESILVSQVLLSAKCVLIFTVCIHTHPLTLLTQVEDTICSNIWFPAFLLSLSLSFYQFLYQYLLSFSFTLVGDNLFKQLFSRFPFLRNVQSQRQKQTRLLLKLPLTYRGAPSIIQLHKNPFKELKETENLFKSVKDRFVFP